MLSNFIERRKLIGQESRLKKEQSQFRRMNDINENMEKYIGLIRASEAIRLKREALETKVLNQKLIKAGLELPDYENYQVGHIKEGQVTSAVTYLTKFERLKIKRALKIEKRATWEFWTKILLPVISTITGLIGVIIGLLTILNK